MANYQHHPMFGQDDDSGSDYATTAADWANVAAGAIGVGLQVYNAATGHPSTTAVAVPTTALPPPVPVAATSSTNSLLIFGILGVGAYLALK